MSQLKIKIPVKAMWNYFLFGAQQYGVIICHVILFYSNTDIIIIIHKKLT
jgi:hypothetical protein